MMRMINNASSEMMSRIGGRLGQSWFSDTTGRARRNLYEALGYIKSPVFEDYMSRYIRGDVAKRIVDAEPNACWRLSPTITETKVEGVEDSKKQTLFEKDLIALLNRMNIFHYLHRADKISGIGKYGAIMLGFDDGKEASEPMEEGGNHELIYMMPYTEQTAAVKTWVENTKDPRYGKPETYQITTSIAGDLRQAASIIVHHSRILHLAEECLENETYGTPRLECILNRLQDLELVAGGSGEMFWRGALPGLNFKVDADADADTIDEEDMLDQMDKYIHGLQRTFRTQGMDIQSIAPSISSPKEHAAVQIMLICAAKGYPMRILNGTERGELASSQDESTWLSKIDTRREMYVEPMILIPFINKMIKYGVLSAPGENGFTVIWPDLFNPSAKDKATTSVNKAQALQYYMNSPGADTIIPPEMFLRDFLEYDDDKIQKVESILKPYLKEKSKMEDEDAKALEELMDRNKLEQEEDDDGKVRQPEKIKQV